MWMSKSVIAVMKDGHFWNYMYLVHLSLCVGVHPSMLTIPTAITSVVVMHHK